MRYLITFSYDGTNYYGLEKQPNYRTIQEELEKALKYINNNQDTKIVASGRTDKRVHAKEQTCHTDISVNITEYKLKRAMNSLLPEDIHIINTKVVTNDFHARYLVLEKIYEYKLNMGEYSPLERNYVYQYNKKLNIEKMQEAIKYFVGTYNFKAFTPTKDKRNNYIRTISKAYLTIQDDVITFTFQGNGFIKYQIRNMVGLLIEVGTLKQEPKNVLKILTSQTRHHKFRTAHPEGLYLKKVIYK